MVKIIFGTWFLVVLFFSSSIYAKCQNKCQSVSHQLELKNTGELVYENGLINAAIKNTSIGKILKQLKAKTGIDIKVNNPAVLESRISAILKQRSVEETIQIILQDFSYALYPSDNGYIVIVLSSNYRTIVDNKNGVETQQGTNLTVPKSLDEFLPITLSELEVKPDIEQNQDDLALEQRREGTVVQRALDTLDSKHQHLHKDALTELVGINDPRATEALINATRLEIDRISRKKAVEELWQHTVNLQFSDNASIDAIRQLSTDGDISISSLALEALYEIEQYQDQNK